MLITIRETQFDCNLFYDELGYITLQEWKQKIGNRRSKGHYNLEATSLAFTCFSDMPQPLRTRASRQFYRDRRFDLETATQLRAYMHAPHLLSDRQVLQLLFWQSRDVISAFGFQAIRGWEQDGLPFLVRLNPTNIVLIFGHELARYRLFWMVILLSDGLLRIDAPTSKITRYLQIVSKLPLDLQIVMILRRYSIPQVAHEILRDYKSLYRT